MGYPTLRQTLEKFVSDEACLEQLGQIRWPTGPRCPKCKGADVIRFQAKGKTGKPRKLYRCLYCRRQFSATVGTIFHDSHMRWAAMAVYKGCALDHLIHQFRSYGNSGLVPPESTVAEAPLGIPAEVFAAMPAGHQPSSGSSSASAITQ